MKLMDLTGKRFGRLTVLKRQDKEGLSYKTPQWLCECECGNMVVVRGHSLRMGETKSCGCLRWLEKGRAMFHRLYRQYVNSAKARNYSFNLPIDLFEKMTKDSCHYCGSAPSRVFKEGRCNGHYLYNGIDRVDNSVGYEVGNVVTCCTICNQAKHTLSAEVFINHIKKIYDHNIGPKAGEKFVNV